jgi:hypothetical protein
MPRRVFELLAVGGPREERGGGGGGGWGGVLRCGKWCLLAFFGVYGEREIIGALRIWRGPPRTYYYLVFVFCISGL